MRWPSSVALPLALCCSANVASAQLLQRNQPSHLIGVRKVSVWVSMGDSDPAVVTKERLRQMAEDRIRSAGLEIAPVPLQRTEASVFAELSVAIAEIRSTSQRFGYAFWTSVRMVAGNSVVLWERGQLSICEEADARDAIEAEAAALLAELLEDWRKANPKQ